MTTRDRLSTSAFGVAGVKPIALLSSSLCIRAVLLATILMCPCVEPERASAESQLNGAFLWTQDLRARDVAPLLDEWRSLGFDTIITTEARVKAPGNQTGTTCDSTIYAWTTGMPELLGIILREAAARQMKVYVGLVFSSGACTVFHTEPNISQDARETRALVQDVLSRWGDSDALHGWYLVDEPALAWETRPDIQQQVQTYYRTQVRAIRRLSRLPILVAPYLGGAYGGANGTLQTPRQVADKALTFQWATGVTVQVWQDSVGDGSIGLASDNAPYAVRDYLDAIVARLGSRRVWSDNELFVGIGESPGPIERVMRQLDESASAGRRISWLPQHHLSAVFPQREQGAADLLAQYCMLSGLTTAATGP